MSSVAIITARGGSKRIPRKNIRNFLGKPIIAYSIETAINSGIFDYVVVSTDDDEIAEVAKKYGADIPFLRSKENSDDYATTADVITEVLRELTNAGKFFDYACCIYPTAPFITENILHEAFTLLKDKNYDSVFPVIAFSYPIQRALKIENEKTSMIWPENMTKRSQDLPPAYHDAGQFYWLNVKNFSVKKKLFTDNTGSVIIEEMAAHDIDNELDWQVAEMKYKLKFPV